MVDGGAAEGDRAAGAAITGAGDRAAATAAGRVAIGDEFVRENSRVAFACKGIRTSLGILSDGAFGVAQMNDDLLAEIQRLRSEINQLREIVNALFNAVFEDEGPDWDAAPDHADQSHLYN